MPYENKYRVLAEIDLGRLKNNLQLIRQQLHPNTQIMAVVKADAYGHGAVPIAQTLVNHGVGALAVVLLEEGIELRKNGIKVPILVLGEVSPHQTEELVHYHLTPMVCSLSLASALNKTGRQNRDIINLHVKVDVGMGSNGIVAAECITFINKLRLMEWLRIEGIFTHLNAAYGLNHLNAEIQISEFNDLLNRLNESGIFIPLIHATSSLTILTMPEAEYNMVRLGALLYGINNHSLAVKTQAVMQLKTRIAFLKHVKAGFKGGYGWNFTTSRNTLIATLPVGYGDAFFLAFVQKGNVLIHGRKVYVLGSVCMDHLMIDVTDIDGAAIGDEVVLLGEQGNGTITVEGIAAREHFAPVLPCLLSRRVPRIYI